MSTQDEKTALNTDRELWREDVTSYYASSVFVTTQGGIGIQVGGAVIVKPLKDWHSQAAQLTASRTECEQLKESSAWICAKCGYGSQEHGMVGHPAHQCCAEMVLRATPNHEIAALRTECEGLRKALTASERIRTFDYMPWGDAGGPVECKHGVAEGIPCRKCDFETVSSLASSQEQPK